jgi:predicted AlkP superfamily pyrophosphatase or phosphodiesterase
VKRAAPDVWPPAWRTLAAVAVVAVALGTGCGRRPSVVLVVLDTVRADAVSAYGHEAGTTPNLDALARNGLLYGSSSRGAASARPGWSRTRPPS